MKKPIFLAVAAVGDRGNFVLLISATRHWSQNDSKITKYQSSSSKYSANTIQAFLILYPFTVHGFSELIAQKDHSLTLVATQASPAAVAPERRFGDAGAKAGGYAEASSPNVAMSVSKWTNCIRERLLNFAGSYQKPGRDINP